MCAVLKQIAGQDDKISSTLINNYNTVMHSESSCHLFLSLSFSLSGSFALFLRLSLSLCPCLTSPKSARLNSFDMHLSREHFENAAKMQCQS